MGCRSDSSALQEAGSPRDCESLPTRSEAVIHIAMADLMARRLTSENTISWCDPKTTAEHAISGETSDENDLSVVQVQADGALRDQVGEPKGPLPPTSVPLIPEVGVAPGRPTPPNDHLIRAGPGCAGPVSSPSGDAVALGSQSDLGDRTRLFQQHRSGFLPQVVNAQAVTVDDHPELGPGVLTKQLGAFPHLHAA